MKHSYGLLMILTCEQCNARYLVPQHAIGADGRTVRCSSCHHQWFQEPEDLGAPLEDFEPPEDIEPIPEGVMPIPEGSDLPAIMEDIAPVDDVVKARHPRALGYAAAAVVFFAIGGALYALHAPIVKIWPPAAMVYEMAGLVSPLPGEGLIFDRVSAVVAPNENGASILNIDGVVVNLTSNSIDMPKIHTTLNLVDGSVSDSWQLNAPENSVGAHSEVQFRTSYPEVQNDVKEVTVSFRSSERKPEVLSKESDADEGNEGHENGESAEHAPAPAPTHEAPSQQGDEHSAPGGH